jgi:ribonuclease Z
MKVCFLGTGGSWPTKRRNPLSIAVMSGSTTILLDCGEGTQRQLQSSKVSPNRIEAIFVTHLHGDHFLGLPGLVQTMSLNDRSAKLMVFGPDGIVKAMEKALSMCVFNSRFDIEVCSINPGDVVRVGVLNISAGEANHSIPALAYRVFQDEKPGRFGRERALDLGIPEGPLWGRLQKGEDVTVTTDEGDRTYTPDMVLGPPRKGLSLCYSGDTGPSKKLTEFARDTDMLIHEATFSSDLEERAREYGHSTASQAAKTAKMAGAGALYLVHSSPRYSHEGDEQVLLDEAREIFPRVFLPEDLDCVEVIR